jgi:tRNA G10  N-methylase Trm11
MLATAKASTAILAQQPNRRRASAETNRLEPADRAAHDWYRFVLSYPPHLVRDYVDKFGLDKDSCVLDPFCGTGTTVVECSFNNSYQVSAIFQR